MFYQGVCDSYTKIRNNNRYGLKRVKVDEYYYIIAKIIIFLWQLIAKKSTKNGKDDLFKITLMFLLTPPYNAGYNYHQKMVKSNNQLKEWVKKENYFNYELPKI